MSTLENFVDKFYNLEGVTLKEKNKSFHFLLKELKSVQLEFLNSVVERLQPRSYLEEGLKVELLLHFRRTDDLLQTLKNGDEIRASKIIRQNWFVNDIGKYQSEQIADELFPALSLSIRTKFLKQYLKYVKNEEKIENLFEVLSKKYGTNVALVLLPGCSVQKIEELLRLNHLQLSVQQMKSLFLKEKSIIVTYLDILKNDNNDINKYEWRSFYKYVSTKDPEFGIELRDKYKIYFSKLGRMGTKKFLGNNKDKVLSDPEKYWNMFRKDAMVRKLGADFPNFYKKLLPKRLVELRYNGARSLIYYYSKNKRYELFFKTFQEVYEKSLWDNNEYMDEKMIEFVKDKEEQAKWIEAFENRSNFKKYLKKRKMAYMSRCQMVFDDDDEDMFVGENAIKQRKTVFNTLISTCKMTKDYSAFLNILESFCERYRNSDVTILYNFLRSVHTDLDMTQLKDEHWKYIREIIAVQIFKKQQTYHPIFLEYIKFLYLQNRPIEDEIRNLIELIPQDLSKFEYKNDAFQKAVLKMFLDFLPSFKDEKLVLTIDIATAVIEWNQKHPKDVISIYQHPSVLAALSKLKDVTKADRKPMRVLKYFICGDGVNSPDLVDVYWSNFKVLNDRTINQWFAKYDPQTLKQHLDKIGIVLKDKNIALVHTLQKYEHLEIPGAITKMCLEELANTETSKRERIVKILVLFMRKEDIIQKLEEYVPKREKLDPTIGDGDAQRNYEFQCALAKHLKSTIYLRDGLPYLLNYCKGDVLGSALPSLYASFYRIPEQQLHKALQQLRTKAVSARKHTIYLSSLVLPVDQVLLKYNSLIKDEKNRSVLQSLFVDCFRYFSKNNVADCWPLLENYMNGLKKQQKDILKLLRNVSKVPREHRARFIQLAWEVMDKLKKDGSRMDENMDSLLRNLEKCDVQLLPDDFCLKILRDKLFNYEERDLDYAVFDFARKFLLCRSDTIRNKIEGLFEIVGEFKKSFWDDNVKKVDVLKVVHKLCVDIFRDYLSEDNIKQDDDQFAEIFRDAWKAKFSIEETFEEHQFLDFLAFRVEGQSLAEQISDAFSKALATYGNLIVGNFRIFVETYLEVTLKGDHQTMETMKFLDALLDCNTSPEQCILVLEMLPSGYYLNDDDKEFQNKLIERLSCQGEIVKIRLYGKLKM